MADIAAKDSLEEINKERIALGMAPIPTAAEGEEMEIQPDEDDVAAANFAQRKEEMRRAKAEAETKERISKLQNQRALNAKLKGSTLGDSGKDDTLDSAAWIKKQKKRAKQREKELAEKRAREMEEADKAAAYDERDLTGLKVGHEADEFETGEDVILTLKDSRVLGEDEDELQNVNMVDDEAVKAAKERKRKAMEQYTGFDDDEFDENRIGVKADVLGKYDDEFASGKLRSEGFRLGAAVEKKPKIENGDAELISLGKLSEPKVKLNLDFAKDFEVSDYMKEGDPGFKQRKVSCLPMKVDSIADSSQKKKAKRSARRADDDDEMPVDGEPTFDRRVVEDTPQNLVDDDDLQAALARARRTNAKKKPKVKAEDLVARGKSTGHTSDHFTNLPVTSRNEEEEGPAGQNGEDDGRITFDDTSEFVRNVNLESRAAPVQRERTSPAAPVVVKIERGEEDANEAGPSRLADADGDEDMESEDEDEGLAEMAAREGMSLSEYRIKIDKQMEEMAQVKAEGDADASEEPVVGSGVAGVLNLLRQQGALKTQTAEEAERERIQKQRDLWLADYRRRQAEREMERMRLRGANMDQAQREWENRVREQNEARDALEAFRNYKPDINIVYHDEFGRQMTPKEAWKSLSHRFHGRTSGRMKTEKRLKKIEEERKELKMSAGDTVTGMTDAFARRQQKTGEAHMVLTVGNKGSVQMGEQKPKIRR